MPVIQNNFVAPEIKAKQLLFFLLACFLQGVLYSWFLPKSFLDPYKKFGKMQNDLVINQNAK